MDYETKIVGAGGTKTVYQVTEDHVVFFPNEQDGKWLEDRWSIIMDDEFFASDYYQKIGVPVIKFSEHNMIRENGSKFVTYGSESFSSMAKKGTYVIDIKSIQKYWKPTKQKRSLEEWKKMTKPIVNDVLILAKYGRYPSYDSQNMIFVNNKSEYHTQSDTDIEMRIFMFDLTSKRYAIDRTHYKIDNPKSLSKTDFLELLNKYIERCAEYFYDIIDDDDRKLLDELMIFINSKIDYTNFCYNM